MGVLCGFTISKDWAPWILSKSFHLSVLKRYASVVQLLQHRSRCIVLCALPNETSGCSLLSKNAGHLVWLLETRWFVRWYGQILSHAIFLETANHICWRLNKHTINFQRETIRRGAQGGETWSTTKNFSNYLGYY